MIKKVEFKLDTQIYFRSGDITYLDEDEISKRKITNLVKVIEEKPIKNKQEDIK